jgi:hypothetical protein
MVENNPKGCKNKSLNCRFLYGGHQTATLAVKKNVFIATFFPCRCEVLCVVEIPLGDLMN